MARDNLCRGHGPGSSDVAWREGREKNRNDEERGDVAVQVSVLGGDLESLNGHDSTVNEARPNCEPDQTEMVKGIARRKKQENTESGVDTEDHLLVLRLIWLPAPARGPKRHHEGVDSKNEDEADKDQGNTEQAKLSIAFHGRSLSLEGIRDRTCKVP
jgi:hypothetical protein